MIKLFDIPGIPAIENRTRLNTLTGVREDHDLDRMILELIAEVFALKPDCDPYDVGFYIEDDDGDEDAIAAWRQDGWDVTRPDGHILGCLDSFAWRMAAAGEGLTQRSMIELEALAWGARTAVKPKADASEKTRNQQFLNLGARRRRAA